MIVPRLIATLALLLLATTPAAAVTLTTPVATPNDGQRVDCIVTNIDTKTIQVAVELINAAGIVVSPSFDDCNSNPLEARTTCQVLGGTTALYCVVTTNSAKVRAGIAVFDGTTDRVNVYYPATR